MSAPPTRRYWPADPVALPAPSKREVPVHYLRPNESEWTPADVVFWDTETSYAAVEEGEHHRLALWAARYVQRRTRNVNLRPAESRHGTTADHLADWLDDVGRRSKTTWCWAHNLAFDVTVTALPLRMARRGWRVTEFSTNDACPFFRLALTDHHLLLTDSWGWLPVALQAIGEAVGLSKPPLPPAEGPQEPLGARCEADVAILERAICQLLDWWDTEGLGRWALTGASCGWNAYRHRAGRRQVVIDPDPEARRFERRALYGGRREAFRIMGPTDGTFREWDLRNAYPTAAATHALPLKRVAAFDTLGFDHPFLHAPNYGVIAEAVVNIDAPRVPVRWGKQVWYPTGRFRTVLASPELAPLMAAGRVESIGPGYAYRLGWSMESWARWVIAVANGEDPGAPPAARLAAKHWSRSVIGKWASRSSTMEKGGPAPTLGWALEEARFGPDLLPGAVVDIAGSRWWVVRDTEGDNTFPAVTVWVESLVRHALSAVMDEIGPSALLQCDTDGLLHDDTTASALSLTLEPKVAARHPVMVGRDEERAAMQKAAAPWALVEKSVHDRLEILGPVHWRTDKERHLSGIPSGASEIGAQQFSYLTWPKLAWQMANGRSDGYLRAKRTVLLRGPYTHRWVLDDGTTRPVSATLDDAGATQLLPWYLSAPPGMYGDLAPAQHPLLEKLV